MENPCRDCPDKYYCNSICGIKGAFIDSLSFFKKEDIKHFNFNWKMLDGKTLTIHVKEIDGITCAAGLDVDTQDIYILKLEV